MEEQPSTNPVVPELALLNMNEDAIIALQQRFRLATGQRDHLRRRYGRLKSVTDETVDHLYALVTDGLIQENLYRFTMDLCSTIVRGLRDLPLMHRWSDMFTAKGAATLARFAKLEKRLDLVLRNVGSRRTLSLLDVVWKEYTMDTTLITLELLVTPIGFSMYESKPSSIVSCESTSKDELEEKVLANWIGSQMIHQLVEKVLVNRAQENSDAGSSEEDSDEEPAAHGTTLEFFSLPTPVSGVAAVRQRGLMVQVTQGKKTMFMHALAKNDAMGSLRELGHFSTKKLDVAMNDMVDMKRFNLVKLVTLRDLMVLDAPRIADKLQQWGARLDKFSDEPLRNIEKECLSWSTDDLLANLQLLLSSEDRDLRAVGRMLFENFNPDPQVVAMMNWNVQSELDTHAPDPAELERNRVSTRARNGAPGKADLPYEVRIRRLRADAGIKKKAYEKLASIREGSGENKAKAKRYLDALLELPLGVVREEPPLVWLANLRSQVRRFFEVEKDQLTKLADAGAQIDAMHEGALLALLEKCRGLLQGKNLAEEDLDKLKAEVLEVQQKKKDYLAEVMSIMDENVHGHAQAKRQVQRLIAQWMQGDNSQGMCIGLMGPPGNGKTTMIMQALNKCLKDEDGNPRPVGFIPMGGSSNASTLVGHGYTYVGSTPGRITQILSESGCANPILLLDEIDKCSQTAAGHEISAVLTALTDPVQNKQFRDRYFDIPLDLSKCLIVCTFNDASKIDPILLDRITVVETKPLTTDDKLAVVRKHLWPELTKAVGAQPSDFPYVDEDVVFIIDTYTAEPGARKLKELLTELVREANLQRLIEGTEVDATWPVTRAFVDQVFKEKRKARYQHVRDVAPQVGCMTGMWANARGMGGILPIQVSKIHSSEPMKLKLTGLQGDTMQESMVCARTACWDLLTAEQKQDLEQLWRGDEATNTPKQTFGFHIHVPDGGVPKDGPSAGGAITAALWSCLTNTPLNRQVSFTGETSLTGSIHAIGGLRAKLTGAKRAGVHLALVPEENREDYELLVHGNPPFRIEDDTFQVKFVSHIKEALPLVIA